MTADGDAVAVGVDIRLMVSVTSGEGVGTWLGADSVTILQPTTHTLIHRQIISGRQPQ